MGLDLSALNRSLSRLYDRKRQLKDDCERKMSEIDIEIAEKKKALAVLNEALKEFSCPNCGGNGEERYTDAAGSRDYRKCKFCKGTGVRMK